MCKLNYQVVHRIPILVRLVAFIINSFIIAESHLTKFPVNVQSLLHNDGTSFPASSDLSSFWVVHPQIHDARYKQVLSDTLDVKDGTHVPLITLSYLLKDRLVQIDLKRNDQLLPFEHFLRYQNSKTFIGYVVQNFTKTELVLCHYQGIIRGESKSRVALSTCNGGINGLIFDGIDTYFIHSNKNGRLQDEHILYGNSNMTNRKFTCGYNKDTDDFFHIQRKMQFSEKTAAGIEGRASIDGLNFKSLRQKRAFDNSIIRGPYNANKNSSYVELVIVVDNKVFKSFGENTRKVHQHCKDLANIINAIYVPLNIFVALIGVVIWNEYNEIEFSNDGDVTLRNFLNYRRTKLVLDHPNDNAQLLTKELFNGGVVGKALKGPICTHEYSGGVSMEHSQIVAVVATTMAHELGHNFGMEHDSPDCKCQDEKCIMSASSTSVVPMHWSSCSKDQLTLAFSRGMNYCLRNKPNKLFDSPQCGNGFVESGEQCDCGLPNYCENSCCDPYTCMLHSNASCATGECCDLNKCRPKVAGTICRGIENECDLPEFCSGESEYCPINVFKRNTEECESGQAYCFQGDCRSHSNQCRVLWGPTGESSEHCYDKNKEGKRGGNCGYNRLNNSFISCETEHVLCGMLHCRHLNERLEFGMESAAVLSHSFINIGGNIVPCRTALVDLGLQSTDPGLAPNGAKCGKNKMCVNQQCLHIEEVRSSGTGKECTENCNGKGICNSRGNCHCDIGYAGEACQYPGPGGSIDSGPSTNPNSHQAFQRFMYIFFFLIIPVLATFCFSFYYCRKHPISMSCKFTEKVIKSSGSSKNISQQLDSGQSISNTSALSKSTPSSTDDINSALLRSPCDVNDTKMGQGMFGKFKGFTLRPLNGTNVVINNIKGSNIAYVQPTIQDSTINISVPQRTAPPPPDNVNYDLPKPNIKNQLSTPSCVPISLAPILQSRPAISKSILDASTYDLPSKPVCTSESLPVQRVPIFPAVKNSFENTIGCNQYPSFPSYSGQKLNTKNNGTIRRFASFIKKDNKVPAKEKIYIEREKLQNLEISGPIAVLQKDAISSVDINTKRIDRRDIIKRTQSMRSPIQKTNICIFSSIPDTTVTARPKSTLNLTRVRPKNPPPRPPSVLKRAVATKISEYQLPVATAKSIVENVYDDCEFIELPNLNTLDDGQTLKENIYSVVEENPSVTHSAKQGDLMNASSNNSEIGLLNEIVNEIQKRSGETLYSKSKLSKLKPYLEKETKSNLTTSLSHTDENLEEAVELPVSKSNIILSNVTTYLSPPIARVAPTRSDNALINTFSTFKPAAVNIKNSTVCSNSKHLKSLYEAPTDTKTEFLPKTMDLADSTLAKFSKKNSFKPSSATIQKPKLIFSKSFISTQKSSADLSKAKGKISESAKTNAYKTPIEKSTKSAFITEKLENNLKIHSSAK